MIDEQKRQIVRLHTEGKTHAEIAAIMDIPPSTVRSFFSRQTAVPFEQQQQAAPALSDGSNCRQCGEPLRLHSGNHMKRFCSERCRQAWWRAHPGLVTEKASSSTCVGCGSIFKNGGNPRRRYCSRACYMKERFGSRREGGDRE